VLRLSYKACRTSMCGNVRKYMRPVSDGIPWTTEQEHRLETGDTRHYYEGYTALLRSPKENLALLTVVEWWCLVCQDKTSAVGSGIFVDNNPRWTLGIVRLLYIERQPRCPNHRQIDEKAPRFVPISLTIPSISAKRLAGLTVLLQHEGIDNIVKACVLDSWPASSRNLREDGKGAVLEPTYGTATLGITNANDDN
jgi:hypothetical protein